MSEQILFQMPVHLDKLPDNPLLQPVELSIGGVLLATGYVESAASQNGRITELYATNSANRAATTTEMWESRPVTP